MLVVGGLVPLDVLLDTAVVARFGTLLRKGRVFPILLSVVSGESVVGGLASA